MEVRLVADQHDGQAKTAKYSELARGRRRDLLHFARDVQQLLVDQFHHLEGLRTGDAVHQHVTVDVYAVLRGEYGILVLSGRVHQLQLVVLVVHPSGLGECWAEVRLGFWVLDSGVTHCFLSWGRTNRRTVPPRTGC